MAEGKKRTALDIIQNYDGPKIRIMEVCGTHTHEIFHQGIRQILPPLGIEPVDLQGASCCPAWGTAPSFDLNTWCAISSRNITIAITSH